MNNVIPREDRTRYDLTLLCYSFVGSGLALATLILRGFYDILMWNGITQAGEARSILRGSIPLLIASAVLFASTAFSTRRLSGYAAAGARMPLRLLLVSASMSAEAALAEMPGLVPSLVCIAIPTVPLIVFFVARGLSNDPPMRQWL